VSGRPGAEAILPIAAGAAHGSSFQEGTMRVLLVSAALSLVSVAVLILWGLRMPLRVEPREREG
jgi:hypothetical protein